MVGETPLAAIRVWKIENQEYAHLPASYAGRLDPMASGKLLVLLGEECKRQHEYTNLDKEYNIEVLLDIGSDTGDVLGMSEYAERGTELDERALAAALASERGAHMRAYPAFSSKTIDGKPLFLHALEGSLSYMKVPEHVECIYNIQHHGSYTI
ncbi:MAG: tRNA pseudouridine55 synthase, partial [Parcubacteria group bacterium Gr01-1014_91]